MRKILIFNVSENAAAENNDQNILQVVNVKWNPHDLFKVIKRNRCHTSNGDYDGKRKTSYSTLFNLDIIFFLKVCYAEHHITSDVWESWLFPVDTTMQTSFQVYPLWRAFWKNTFFVVVNADVRRLLICSSVDMTLVLSWIFLLQFKLKNEDHEKIKSSRTPTKWML